MLSLSDLAEARNLKIFSKDFQESSENLQDFQALNLFEVTLSFMPHHVRSLGI